MTPGAAAPAPGPVHATVSTERGTALVVDGPGVTFGRAADVDVRIGAAPIYDELVPRLAGRVFSLEGRVVVENLDDRLAFDLRVDGRPLIAVPPGDWHSPRERTFEVLVAGSVTTYELAITVNVDRTVVRRPGPEMGTEGDDPPTGAVPHLTERQRAILDAYVEPLARGGMVASHQQVADRLGISRSLVRVECERIWSALLLAGVPMRDLGDARDQVVDAWSRHRI